MITIIFGRYLFLWILKEENASKVELIGVTLSTKYASFESKRDLSTRLYSSKRTYIFHIHDFFFFMPTPGLAILSICI